MGEHLANTPSVLVVILNYRTADLAIQCLASAQDNIKQLVTARVVVVDNCSGDGSVEQLTRAIADNGWSQWASVVASAENAGYSAGNNLAIRPALASDSPPDFVILLNPDTRVVDNALVTLVRFMTANPNVGIGGPRLEWEDGTPRMSAFRFPGIASELIDGSTSGVIARALGRLSLASDTPKDSCPTDWVPGAAMIVRREVYQSVGLMDEAYFLYYEEVDFCLQASRAGWPCWFVGDATVIHIEGQATGVEYGLARPKRRPRYWFDSRRRFFVKNFGRPYAIAADISQIGGHLIWYLKRLAKRILKRQTDSKPESLLLDLVRSSALWNR